MSYLLDTDVCIDLLRNRNRELVAQLGRVVDRVDGIDCLTSAVVEAELMLGALKSLNPAEARAKVENFLSRFSVLAIDQKVAKKYAELRSALEAQGTRIGENDLFIAATAMVYDLTLLSRNTREYARVPGLKFTSP